MTVDAMRKFFAMLAVVLFAGALGACEEQGTAEQTGEAVDDAVDEAGEAVEETGDAAEEATTN